ncbi:MAG: ABC transporter ATP-binding protein [Clostridiales bacterium]|nr:ABC transporter ATP-binding protein [Clostridiales bacterium]
MIKKLLRSVREYKRASILTPIFVAIEVVLEVAIPFVMSYLIDYLDMVDKGVVASDMWQILKYAGILVVLAGFAMVFGALSGVQCAKASTGFAKNLRGDLFAKVQTLSFSNIDKFSTSSLVTRLTTDVSNVQMAYQMIIRIAVRAPLMMLFSLTMSFVISPNVGWVFLIAIPILFGGLLLILSTVNPIFKKVMKHYDRMNLVVQENVRGIRAVKAYNREDYEVEKFSEVSEDIYTSFSKAEKITSLNGPLMKLVIYVTIILTSWIGARVIIGSGGALLQTGDLSTLITYGIQLLSSLMMMSMVLVMIVIARAGAGRIIEVLDEVPDIANPDNPVDSVADGSIEFSGVNFSYANDINKLCLSDVNIRINSGEVVGIIGGTGSSKTTLVQLIPRLYDATVGEVKVGGRNVKEYDIEALRDQVSMVLQKNVLFSGTIRDNLKWGNENATDEEIIEACKMAEAHDFIMKRPDGYDSHIEQGGTNVSGGQKQRLCIARALLKKPKIIILDDSTSAVDTKTDRVIQKNFASAIPNTTKIIIAQRISSIQHADQIIVMDGGKVADVGKHAELLKRCAIYQDVYYSQVKGGKK